MIGNLNTLVSRAANKLYVFSAYTLGAYVFLGIFYSLLHELSVTSLNILFGVGLGFAAIMIVPAIMATDSRDGVRVFLFSRTIFSYPMVYLLSLLASRWIPGIADNSEWALIAAALPLINVVVMIAVVVAALTMKK